MLKLYIFWGIFIAIVIGVVVSQVIRRRHSRHPQTPPPSTRMQFHAHAEAGAPGSGTPKLMCLGESHHGHHLAIPPGGLSIGRANDNLLIIVDGRISAHHAWIGVVGGRILLRDYQSLNGTFLNADMDSRVSEVALVAGDTILFGGDGGEQFRLVVE